MLAEELLRQFREEYIHLVDDRTRREPGTIYENTRVTPGTQDTIVVLYTGGTIGSKLGPNGYAPAKISNLEEFFEIHPELQAQYAAFKQQYPNTEFVFEAIDPLDSGAMNDSDRVKIIRKTSELSQKYGNSLMSFLCLHGTDSAVETGCLMDNYFGDGSIPILLVTSQYAPGRLGGDGPSNFLHAVALSHCDISGVYLVANGTIFHPADARKQSDSGLHIFGTEGYGFGEAGHFFDGGARMDLPYTARRIDPTFLPFVPEGVLDNATLLDSKGQFLYVANTLTAHQITQQGKEIVKRTDLEAVVIEARGAASITKEALDAALKAAGKGIPTLVTSVVPQSTGALHYEIAAGLNKPGIFRAPGIASTLHRRYAAFTAASYARYLIQRKNIAPASPTADPLIQYADNQNSLGPYHGNQASAAYALFAAILTRGQRLGMKYADSPVLPQVGFQQLLRQLAA